jgi:hypothetical protein
VRGCVLGLAFVLTLGLTAAPSAAQAPSSAVAVTVEGLFGSEALVEGGWGAVLVTLTSRSAENLSGELVLEVTDWDVNPELHALPMDLPAGTSRRVPVVVFLPTSGAGIEARYVVDGGSLGFGTTSVAYAAGASPIVVIAEQPARLRAALLGLERELPSAGAGSYGYAPGPERTVVVPVGGASLDPRTGDPLLPTEPLAYATAAAVIASLPTLSRAREAELRALDDYVLAGGTLVLSARTPLDWSLPLVREHFGEVSTSSELTAPVDVAPRGTPAITCTRADHVDGHGCARAHGLGVVRLAPMDLANPAAEAGAGWPIAFVRDLLDERDAHARVVLPFGLGRDRADRGVYGGESSFGAMRRALDPNEGYRSALGLVALLLLAYVVVIGPLHFKLIERRNQPTLALVTTPALALACAAALLVVGVLGKGVQMRYRRVSLLEVLEGEGRGASRSYTGFFFTRPASLRLAGPERGAVRRIAAPAGLLERPLVHREGRVDADGLRGGLWDTVFVREDGLVDLPGGVRFERDERRFLAVVNASPQALRSAFFVDATGSAFPIGDLPAGGRAPIPEASGAWLSVTPSFFGGEGGDTNTDALAFLLNVPGERALVMGLQAVLAGDLVPDRAGALYAWIDAPAPWTASPGFAPELDRRLLRVSASMPFAPLSSAERSGAAGPEELRIQGLLETLGAGASPSADATTGGAP